MHQRIQMIAIQFNNKKCILFNNHGKTIWTVSIKEYFLRYGTEGGIKKIWISFSSFIKPKHPLRQCNMLDIQFYLDEEGYGRTLGHIIFKPGTKSVYSKIENIMKEFVDGKTS